MIPKLSEIINPNGRGLSPHGLQKVIKGNRKIIENLNSESENLRDYRIQERVIFFRSKYPLQIKLNQ